MNYFLSNYNNSCVQRTFNVQPAIALCFLLFLSCLSVVFQTYSVNVMDENVLRGNTAIVKCHIPSFVADFVIVDAWIEIDEDERSEYHYHTQSFGRDNLAIAF